MTDDDETARAHGARRGTPFLNTAQAAAWLGLSARLLERLRRKGEGPDYRRHSRFIRYHVDDLAAWSNRHAGRGGRHD
jgi:hypothetical protein